MTIKTLLQLYQGPRQDSESIGAKKTFEISYVNFTKANFQENKLGEVRFFKISPVIFAW